jgi:hypothetical protein
VRDGNGVEEVGRERLLGFGREEVLWKIGEKQWTGEGGGGNAGARRGHLMADPPQPHSIGGAVRLGSEARGRRIANGGVWSVGRENGGGARGEAC